jgi:hypothetical protein
MNTHHKLLTSLQLIHFVKSVTHNRLTSMLVLTQCPFLSIDTDKILKNVNNGPKYFIVSYLHMSHPSKL